MWKWLFRRKRSPDHLDFGRRAEAAAAKQLRRSGYRLLGRNVKAGFGEIDLLAEDRQRRYLVVVEVKAGRGEDPPPEGHVNDRKQWQLTRLGCWAAKKYRRTDRIVRFDVVGVVWPKGASKPTRLTHHVGAFESKV